MREGEEPGKGEWKEIKNTDKNGNWRFQNCYILDLGSNKGEGGEDNADAVDDSNKGKAKEDNADAMEGEAKEGATKNSKKQRDPKKVQLKGDWKKEHLDLFHKTQATAQWKPEVQDVLLGRNGRGVSKEDGKFVGKYVPFHVYPKLCCPLTNKDGKKGNDCNLLPEGMTREQIPGYLASLDSSNEDGSHTARQLNMDAEEVTQKKRAAKTPEEQAAEQENEGKMKEDDGTKETDIAIPAEIPMAAAPPTAEVRREVQSLLHSHTANTAAGMPPTNREDEPVAHPGSSVAAQRPNKKARKSETDRLKESQKEDSSKFGRGMRLKKSSTE